MLPQRDPLPFPDRLTFCSGNRVAGQTLEGPRHLNLGAKREDGERELISPAPAFTMPSSLAFGFGRDPIFRCDLLQDASLRLRHVRQTQSGNFSHRQPWPLSNRHHHADL